MTIQPTEIQTEATGEDERAPEMSLVLSTGGSFFVEAVASDRDKPIGVQRLAVHFGKASVYIMREDVPALISRLLVAMDVQVSS
jgi:hypothetical protein